MKKGALYIALATLFFSTMEISLKEVSGQFNPMQMTLTRFLIGGLVLIPFAYRTLKKRNNHLDRQSVFYFALLGLIGIVISMTFFQLAVLNAHASVVAVLFSSNPVFVLVLAYFILHEPIRSHQVAALLLEVVGILVLINPLNTQISAAGIAFSLLATMMFALYGVLSKQRCNRFGGAVVTCGSFLFGSLEMLLLAGISHIAPVARFLTGRGLSLFADIPLFTGYTTQSLPVFLYICVCVTGAGYAFYFMAMEATSTSMASLVFFFKPALAPLFALILLHEAIPFNMFIGIVLIVAGSLVSLLPTLIHADEKQEEEEKKLATEELEIETEEQQLEKRESRLEQEEEQLNREVQTLEQRLGDSKQTK